MSVRYRWAGLVGWLFILFLIVVALFLDTSEVKAATRPRDVVNVATYSITPKDLHWRVLGEGDDDSTYYYATSWRSMGYVVSVKKAIRAVSGMTVRFEFIEMVVECEPDGRVPDEVGLLSVTGIDGRKMMQTDRTVSDRTRGDPLILKRGSAYTTAVVAGCARKNQLSAPSSTN